VRKSIMISQW